MQLSRTAILLSTHQILRYHRFTNDLTCNRINSRIIRFHCSSSLDNTNYNNIGKPRNDNTYTSKSLGTFHLGMEKENDNIHPLQTDALSNVPIEKRISVLYHDDSIIVINKPPKLRSVPGHASETAKTEESSINNELIKQQDLNLWKNTPQVTGPPEIGDKKRKYHETWAYALQEAANSVSDDNGNVTGSVSVNGLIKSLAALPNSSVVPRKRRTFIRYCVRTKSRLVKFDTPQGNTSEVALNNEKRAIVEKIAEKAFTKIHKFQQPLLNLPKPTNNEESALGQLKILGFQPCPEVPIKVVHRLDMETSGVMVFARNDQAASKLCEAWRERDQIDKVYLAQVKSWPPLQNHNLHKGSINLALAPSEERLKWKVKDDGKPSQTLWTVKNAASIDGNEIYITLSLKPITGRTHQLRIHCASIGSGIVGDSLYGDDPVEWTEDVTDKSSILRLHANKLSIPHPVTNNMLSFETLPDWLTS